MAKRSKFQKKAKRFMVVEFAGRALLAAGLTFAKACELAEEMVFEGPTQTDVEVVRDDGVPVFRVRV